jgi:hypothetical protein
MIAADQHTSACDEIFVTADRRTRSGVGQARRMACAWSGASAAVGVWPPAWRSPVWKSEVSERCDAGDGRGDEGDAESVLTGGEDHSIVIGFDGEHVHGLLGSQSLDGQWRTAILAVLWSLVFSDSCGCGKQ